MKGLIIYKGKYGATKQYAEWLSELLNVPSTTTDNVNPHQLANANFLIIGTSIYIGKFVIKDWITKNKIEIQNKKLLFFIVTATPSHEKEKLNGYVKANFPQEIIDVAEIHFLPGQLIFNKLSWLDKILLRMGASFAKTPEEKKRMLTDFNEVKKENLDHLVRSVQGFCF